MTRFSMVRVLAGTAAVLVAGACKDLDVTNPNNPDIQRALASPEDVQNLAVSSVNSWYLASTNYNPYMLLQVTADVSTGNYGNFGMRFNNLEPRIPYGNSSAGGDRDATEWPWEDNYGTLGAANDVLTAITAGVEIDDPATTDKYKVLAMFSQAASLGNIGLLFDRGFIVDETFIPGTSELPVLVPYQDVIAAAITKWDGVIAATSSASETYAIEEFPLPAGATTAALNRIANSMAAYTLAESSRNAAETASLDWARILAYAEKGISGDDGRGPTFDWEFQGDDNNWYSMIVGYGNLEDWVKTDMRVICQMDPTKVCKYDGSDPGPITNPAADDRALSDYRYLTVIGDPNRGIYMQSPFHHTRYEDHSFYSPSAFRTPVPYMLKAENDLLIAEALARTGGDLDRAAQLINRTRVDRGGLTPATAADGSAGLLAMIAYERDVELVNTSGQQLYDRRRIDGLQPGTMRHLPIPAAELETLVLPVYTFGGVGKPDMVILSPSGQELGLRLPPKHKAPTRMQLIAPKW